MSLYLTIFDGDEDVVGWVFGHYSDFGYFRDTIAAKLRSADYPTLMTHSDCDGEWSAAQLLDLRRELQSIATAFRRLPPEEPKKAFEHTAEHRCTLHQAVSPNLSPPPSLPPSPQPGGDRPVGLTTEE